MPNHDYPPAVYAFLERVAVAQRGIRGLPASELTAEERDAWQVAEVAGLVERLAPMGVGSGNPWELRLTAQGGAALARRRLAPAPPADAPAVGRLKAGSTFANTPTGRALAAELQAVADSPEWRALAAELETTTKQGRRDWEAHYGEPYPASLGDWQRLLVRAGVNPNDVLAGHIEIGDAAAVVCGYLERVRDMRAASPPPATLKSGAAREYPEAVYRFLERLEATISEARARGVRDGWVPHVPGTPTDEDAWRVAGHAGLVAHISGSDALQPAGRAALARWRLEAADAPTGEPTAPATAASPKRRPQEEWQAQALLKLKAHPDWPDARIAKAVGVDKSTLSRCELYKAAANMARGEKPKPTGKRRRVKPLNPHEIDD